jgi:hypothetical protein
MHDLNQDRWARLYHDLRRYLHPSENAVLSGDVEARVGTEMSTARMSQISCRLRKMEQAQYIELVACTAPVAQLDRASAF